MFGISQNKFKRDRKEDGMEIIVWARKRKRPKHIDELFLTNVKDTGHRITARQRSPNAKNLSKFCSAVFFVRIGEMAATAAALTSAFATQSATTNVATIGTTTPSNIRNSCHSITISNSRKKILDSGFV